MQRPTFKKSEIFYRQGTPASADDIFLQTTDGESMARKIGAIAYIENSAVTMDGVRNVRKIKKKYLKRI